MASAGYEDVVIAAPVSVPYVRYSIRAAHWFVARALRDMLDIAKLPKNTLDGVCVSSFTLAPDSAIGLMQHLDLCPRWLDYIPLGGASGPIALRRAARAVQCGDADVVACVAADTNHVDSFRLTLSNFSMFARDAVYPYGAGGPNASFALLTAHYMRQFGATREDFGKLCVAQRANALQYPSRIFRKPLTLAEYMDSRPIADPLHLYDCVMPCAGAEGFLVMREARARDLGLPFVRILATQERHNAFAQDPIQIRAGWAMDRERFFADAGVTHDQVDFMQTYDDYPVISVMQFEDLGFCAKGEGPQFVREHSFTNDGSFPVNTNGGQLSTGQAGAAGGFLGLVESVRQLTGQAGGTTVAGARIGLACGFGMINFDRGLSTSAVLLARVD